MINLHDQKRFVDVLSAETAGCTIDDARNIMCQSLNVLLQEITSLPDWDFHNHNIDVRNKNMIIWFKREPTIAPELSPLGANEGKLTVSQ